MVKYDHSLEKGPLSSHVLSHFRTVMPNTSDSLVISTEKVALGIRKNIGLESLSVSSPQVKNRTTIKFVNGAEVNR